MPKNDSLTFTLPKVVNGRARTQEEALAEAKTKVSYEGFRTVSFSKELANDYEFVMYR